MFYIDTGGQDVASAANFFGISGGRNWEREFTRKSPMLAKAINDIVDDVIESSLLEEIVLRTKEIMKDKVSLDVIEKI